MIFRPHGSHSVQNFELRIFQMFEHGGFALLAHDVLDVFC